jgi:hypothetical protein
MGEEQNLEAVRRWLHWPDGTTRADRARLVDELFDERCDYYPVRAIAEAAPCHGREEVILYMNYFEESWERWDLRLAKLEAIDTVRALAEAHIHAVGKSSGAELDGQIFFSFWFRNGRILRLEDHLTERGAREGLGL